MAFMKTYDELPVITTVPCIHLRNKAMYVRGVVGDAENFPDETGAGQCWCNMTQHCLGPDTAYVNRQQCVPGRECYKETY